MGLNFLNIDQSSEQSSLVQKDSDPAKYDAIAAKLCDKRKLIEDTSHQNSLPQEERENLALSLIQIKQDMTIFGISEIDYQAYLASKEKEAALSSAEQDNTTTETASSVTTLVEPD